MRKEFQIVNLSVRPGEKTQGYVPVYETGLELPVTIIHSKEEGDTILITSGLHSAEYPGIQTAIELASELDPAQIRGTVILVHPLNISGFLNRNLQSCVEEDKKNLNGVFMPGNKNGTQAEQIAHQQAAEFQSKADFYLDLHSGGDFTQLAPYVYYVGVAEKEVIQRAKKMAQAVCVPYMVCSQQGNPGIYNYAGMCSIPSILIERGCQGIWNEEEVEQYKEDVRNVLRSLGCLKDGKKPILYEPAEVVNILNHASSFAGCWYPAKNAGEQIELGEKLGEVRDCFGKVLETYYSERSGVILYQNSSLCIPKKSNMITYGDIKR